ncbi:MAG: hypothetical protein ACE5IM_06950, partial [Nitrospinota bacterium]
EAAKRRPFPPNEESRQPAGDAMSLTALNRIVYDLQFPDLRERFRADPAAFLAAYDLTEEESAALKGPDLRALWRLGANPYLLRFFQHWNHITDDAFRESLRGLSFPGSVEGTRRG